MIHFSTIRLVFIGLICSLSLLLATPSFLSKDQIDALPNWLPKQSLSFGLDLQGGSQLLLEIDFDSYLRDQIDLLKGDIVSELRHHKIGYHDLKAHNSKISFSLRNTDHGAQLNKIISKINRNLEINKNDDLYVISYNEEELRALREKLIEQSIKIVRKRVDETGTKEPSIQRQGDNYILLQVPGLDNPGHLKAMLGQTAKLSFHLVVDNANIEEALNGHVPAGTMLLEIDDSKSDKTRHLLLNKKVVLSGDRLTNASASFANENKAVVSIAFDRLGAKQFGDFTTSHVNQALAIVLDNKVISYANISEPITGGNCQISGNFSTEQAHNLALLLRAGALPAPLKIIEERTVGPNLGADSIEAGKKTFLVSFCLISVFMIIFYGIMGVFANIALIANIIFIISILSLFQASLTMPGIAGIILTIGMAVDANVLIFERIRDELKNGRSLLSAMDRGFNQAFTTIFDSNITTILVAIILYYFGSGAVRGFAVTLTIGIGSSMFSAITLTKLMMWAWFKSHNSRTKAVKI